MIRKLVWASVLLLPLTVVPAHAEESFLTCPSGRTAIASVVTSCAFADNVRASLLAQGGLVIQAYSPVTGKSYQMQCYDRFVAHLDNGWGLFYATRCNGGDNAVVFVW